MFSPLLGRDAAPDDVDVRIQYINDCIFNDCIFPVRGQPIGGRLNAL
jgi:hypothetical protein